MKSNGGAHASLLICLGYSIAKKPRLKFRIPVNDLVQTGYLDFFGCHFSVHCQCVNSATADTCLSSVVLAIWPWRLLSNSYFFFVVPQQMNAELLDRGAAYANPSLLDFCAAEDGPQSAMHWQAKNLEKLTAVGEAPIKLSLF